MNIQIINLIFTAIILIISISLHEYAHAWMANKLGDPTPRLQGRLTPNPIAHIDPLGFILVFIINFGRGKAVEYNPNYLRHPLKDELQIALAGPIMNILLTIVGIVILVIYQKFNGMGANGFLLGYNDLVIVFWLNFCYMNISLAVFNMIPIPPLDGYRLLKIRYPSIFYKIESSYRQHAFILIAILSISGAFGGFISTTSQRIFALLYSMFGIFL